MMNVKWSDVAQLQLKEILLFYTKRNGSNQYSKKLKKKVNELVKHFRRNPEFGELLPQESNCRRVCIEYFEILYTVEQDYLEIASFRDARRNYMR